MLYQSLQGYKSRPGNQPRSAQVLRSSVTSPHLTFVGLGAFDPQPGVLVVIIDRDDQDKLDQPQCEVDVLQFHVPSEGLEPSRPFEHQVLSLA